MKPRTYELSLLTTKETRQAGMKAVVWNLMILSILSFGLSSCKKDTVMYQQISSGYVDCKNKDIQILDAEADLNSTESWTAICGGKKYLCTYHSSAGSDCTEISE